MLTNIDQRRTLYLNVLEYLDSSLIAHYRIALPLRLPLLRESIMGSVRECVVCGGTQIVHCAIIVAVCVGAVFACTAGTIKHTVVRRARCVVVVVPAVRLHCSHTILLRLLLNVRRVLVFCVRLSDCVTVCFGAQLSGTVSHIRIPIVSINTLLGAVVVRFVGR